MGWKYYRSSLMQGILFKSDIFKSIFPISPILLVLSLRKNQYLTKFQDCHTPVFAVTTDSGLV